MLQNRDTQPLLQPDQARQLTDRIRASAEELKYMLLEAYEGGAHTALGYSSWGAYFKAEFGETGARGYQLLDAERVHRAIGEHSTIVERPNEAQARELAPLVKEDPETAKRIWGGLSAEHGDDLTAKHVKKAVAEVRESKALREELPPATRTVVENSDPEDCSLSRSVPQLKHLRDIAAKRGDDVAAQAAERVANGEFKSTFDAYPEVKREDTPNRTGAKGDSEEDIARAHELVASGELEDPPQQPTKPTSKPPANLPKDEDFFLTREEKAVHDFAQRRAWYERLDLYKLASAARTPEEAQEAAEAVNGIADACGRIGAALERRARELSQLRRVK